MSSATCVRPLSEAEICQIDGGKAVPSSLIGPQAVTPIPIPSLAPWQVGRSWGSDPIFARLGGDPIPARLGGALGSLGSSLPF